MDECSWPKLGVWPFPPPSLTSFTASSEGRKSKFEPSKRRGGTLSNHGPHPLEAAAAHPCFAHKAVQLAAQFKGGAQEEKDAQVKGAERANAALATALWVRHEWAALAAEQADEKGLDPAQAAEDIAGGVKGARKLADPLIGDLTSFLVDMANGKQAC